MDGAIAVLTLALVVITGYYAWQNRQMVDEMRLARKAGARPHLALCFEPLGPMNVMVGLVNLGPGAALSIDLTIVFHPREGSDFSGETRRWRGELLAAGAQRDFFVPDSTGKMMSIQRLAEAVDRIEMAGTMLDVLGVEHAIRGEIGALDEWDELLRNAHERYKEPSLDKLVKETAKLSKAMDKAVSKWTAFGGGLHVRTDADLAAEREEWMKEIEEASAEMNTGAAVASASESEDDSRVAGAIAATDDESAGVAELSAEPPKAPVRDQADVEAPEVAPDWGPAS